MYTSFRFFIFFLGSCITASVFAVGEISAPSELLVPMVGGTPSGIIANIIAYGIGIAGILGVIGLTWNGIQMILAAGEDEKVKKAKYGMIYSIVGVLIAGLAYGIVQVVGNLQI